MLLYGTTGRPPLPVSSQVTIVACCAVEPMPVMLLYGTTGRPPLPVGSQVTIVACCAAGPTPVMLLYWTTGHPPLPVGSPVTIVAIYQAPPHLKGQCHEIFDFWFFSWISFPQAPEYTFRAVSNFFENLRRYSQLKVHHRCCWHRWQMNTCTPSDREGGRAVDEPVRRLEGR